MPVRSGLRLGVPIPPSLQARTRMWQGRGTPQVRSPQLGQHTPQRGHVMGGMPLTVTQEDFFGFFLKMVLHDKIQYKFCVQRQLQ